MAEDVVEAGAVEALVQARHGDPFALLGPHVVPGGIAVRAFLPDAERVDIIGSDTGEVLAPMRRLHADGVWSGVMEHAAPYRLRACAGDHCRDVEDTYRFPPLLGEMDIYLLGEGRHRDFARVLGAHVVTLEGVAGVRFVVWAPNAQRVSVVGSFNNWDGRRHPMRLRQGSGMWELFVPGIGAGVVYKYEIVGPSGEMLPLKADPVAWATELPPATGSVVADPAEPVWTDAEWMATRAARQAVDAPISVYECHAMSWLPNAEAGGFNWATLADRLVPYLQRLGFTHVELLPIMEHPFGGSWGYQPLGQFAPTARLGAPNEFAAFVDRCHAAGLGVILDWVPAHFPTDAHGLARFDGTALYEHADPREGFHRDWNTYIFNHGRNEVRAFLIGSALHWLERFHVDALRVDAVASMLYRDYSRDAGEWIPNQFGGRENLEAIEFFHELRAAVDDRVTGAVLIAEESTAFPRVSRPVDAGGLGFHYKWNMGWMHDSLHYIEETPINRRWHHGSLTFGLVYAFTENFLLPISHDEVVYGKGSLIGKMPGDTWQKFANARAYLGFMWTHPGKKLLFMGSEFAQAREWNHDRGLDWFELDNPMNKGVQAVVRDLNHCYTANRALHVMDTMDHGFRWSVIDDDAQSVFAFIRYGTDQDPPVLVVCNFTPVTRYGYRIGVPAAGLWHEILNTDATVYGGSGAGNGGSAGADRGEFNHFPASISLTLPPLATIILKAA